MPLLNATSVAAVLILLYLSSFLLLAILRIATGVSIQRIGYFSLRHISYTPREGLRIDLRGLGLSPHRPTFAQPTWISLVFEELKVTIDPAVYENSPQRSSGTKDVDGKKDSNEKKERKTRRLGGRSKLWKKLTNIKEWLKRIHRKIHILRMFDISFINTSAEVVGVGYVQVSNFTMAVYTRRRLLDRGRLFRHKKEPLGTQKPAEWVFAVRSVLLGSGGHDPIEILDNMTINVHGLLYKEREGLRDTSIAIKAGRLYAPVDEILQFTQRAQKIQKAAQTFQPSSPAEEITFEDLVEELDQPGSREASIVQTVADSKEFFSSVLRSVQEIQIGLSFVRISKEIVSLRRANLPLIANMVIHEIGVDLHRLDQNSPSHRMYFSKDDVAHQALVAAVSISVSLDEDDYQSNKIMYIPMATTTIRTTLPSKTMSFTHERDVAERNANILFANLVVTSPSLDLVPPHLMKLLAVAQSQAKPTQDPPQNRHRLISRLLPKASIKFSIHEPVVRFILPVANPTNSTPGDYDMIISSITSISLDVESSHSAGGELLYSLGSNFRVMSHQLYYQASTGVRHNIIVTEALEIKVQVSASTEVAVSISGNLRTFSILMVREEVSKAIYNIVRHVKRRVPMNKPNTPRAMSTSFLRKLPSWIIEASFEGSGFSIETAGIDSSVSSQTRGVALELESWTSNYTSSRLDMARKPITRRKTSASARFEDSLSAGRHLSPPTSPPRHRHSDPTDGRRLTFHVKGLDGYIIESLDSWEPKPFTSIPRFEVAFSTSRDQQGPLFHINSSIRAIYLEFSLYRLYSIGVAGSIVKDAFLGPAAPLVDINGQLPIGTPSAGAATHLPVPLGQELSVFDVKAHYVQIKGHMPADPPMMLQVYQVAGGRHRWSAPFLRADLVRLHAEAPHMRGVYARIVSTSNLRLDLRHVKRKTLHGMTEEHSIDVSTEFIRLAVPHGLQMYKIFDNFVNTGKAIAQLRHRFKTRTNEYILKKEPVGPKKVPRVSLRSKVLCFELEDDPFEWKLGVIYHAGRIEQKQRLAREDAYRLKVKRLQEDRRPRSTSRFRGPSSRHNSPDTVERNPRRSKSADLTPRRRSASRGRRRESARLRYDREGACALTTSAKIQADEAWQKLLEHNARSWKRRVDWMMRLQNKTIKSIRQMFAGADEPPHDSGEHEAILGVPNRPGLMTAIISDLHLLVDKPSFPSAELPKFLNEIGKGMPYDTQYALLVPLSLSLDMGEARVMLRDYPLNLLHIPAIRPGQSARLPSWSLRTDFIIAEEYRDEQSIRHVKVEIVPKGQHIQSGEEIPGFYIDVRRTVSPVKTFSKPVVDINTSLPTTISWGTSYQPVIQDMMMTIEGFTKPEIDPSERVGFWDKIRMSFHSRLVVNWKGDGDVQLRLKGSRDPYVVTGYGAGFVMCWRNDVQWSIHSSDDPREFMTVRSGEYILAIPDYSHEARNAPEQQASKETDSMSTSSSQKNAAIFKKVIMKVSGNVQWTAGLVFERALDDGGRSSSFIPHYDVILKNPAMMHGVDMKGYDAFRGFRSQHIHLSIAIAAPFDRDWLSADASPSESYNSVHLSPRFFSHFFNWWSLFSGVMSLPIRQGPLWRGVEKSSKKFGRHLATIKYGLLLSPLFIAHVYKHKDAEDYQEDVVSATGLKIKIDSFMLDLHQRREHFDTLSKGKSEQMRTSAMKINKAELDFMRADLRAVAASIAGTTAEDLQKATDESLSAFQEVSPNIDMSQFTIPDRDFTWIDMDDFVELDWVLPAESNPETKILPLAFTPRFTYFRQTDHGPGGIQGDESRTSPFGEEDTHFCVMSRHNDPRKVQMNLIESRLHDLEDKLQAHMRIMSDHELKVIRDGDHDQAVMEKQKTLVAQRKELDSKRKFLQHGLQRLMGHGNPGEHHESEKSSSSNRHGSTATSVTELVDAQNNGNPHVDMDALYSSAPDEFASDFNNRFIIHNAQFKWHNSLRNIILRYSHQVSQRRGFVYYMSRRAVKFLLDIVDEQAKAKEMRRRQEKKDVPPVPATPSVISPSDEKDEDSVVQDRINQLLSDATRFVHAGDSDRDTSPKTESVSDSIDAASERRPSTADLGDKIAENFQAMNSYHLRLIAPQIQLQSEKNEKAVALIATKGMQLKVVSIMDKARISDDVSGLVQRRFALDMDGAQFFVASQKTLAQYLHLYSGNRYGNAPGSSWPPWVSLEAMFDFHLEPFGFQRVIQKTSASLRYEKYNPLRLKYNEEVESDGSGESKNPSRREDRIDHLWVDFPRVRARCDSQQYYTMYIIVLDLLLYSEPLEKTRSERLEKIMLASDFSDLRGAPEIAQNLQERIRQLEEIKLHFQINAKYLDKRGWQDRINLEKDLTSCEDELFFIMKAINTSQQRNDDRKASETSGLLRWYLSASEIVWHLMLDKDQPLTEFQLGNAAYERVDNSDGSNHNALEVEHIRGWNLLTNALYPEIIGPYYEPGDRRHSTTHAQKMVEVHWYMLEAIAGIPVLEQFFVTVHPLKVQLERELGKKLFEYIFPGVGSNAFESDNFSPLMVQNMAPLDEGNDQELEDAQNALMSETDLRGPSMEQKRDASPGEIARRLKPTYGLSYKEKATPSTTQPKYKGLGIGSEHHKFFKHFNASNPRSVLKEPTRKGSSGSLRSNKGNNASSGSLVALGNAEEKKLNMLHRTTSKERGAVIKKSKDKKEKPSDDLSQMMARASNYMTLAHVKLNTFIICLSYKGKGDRNIEDLHDFVFRMPTLEYRNKTWSNLDLALRLKKDVIRALISHTGAIIGNKFSHHRPNKKQVERLKEIAMSSTIPNSDINLQLSNTSENTSLYSFSQDSKDDDFESSGITFQSPTAHENGHGKMPVFGTGGPSPLLRSGSWSSNTMSKVPVLQMPRSMPPPSIATASSSTGSMGPPARPNTATSQAPSSGGGSRNLLKDTIGRHFSGESSKGRGVHFGPLSLGKSESHKDVPSTMNHGRDGQHDDGAESDPEGHRRKSVLLLGKKVLNRLS
ncbi:Protein SABRE [Knufia peltigerae]|uniref:Protein SABRE n=1 Tax=Knufia peltigerae TaxID=1002370 RepID=A0AA39D3I3_9EURO|nr:Protein SABRE [Knufia peltigerae]